MRAIAIFLIGVVIGSSAARAASTPKEALLVLSKGDHTLAIVDPSDFHVVARMPSGPDPHEVAASTDGKFAYISNYGGGAYNTLTVVDLTQQKTLTAIDLGALRGPHGLIYRQNKVWFTAEAAKALGSYDPATKKINFILGTGQNRTHMIYVSDDVNRIVTSNIASATMSIIEKVGSGPPGRTREDWNQTLVPVGGGCEGFDLSPDKKEIWVANAADGTVSVIDNKAKKVIQTLDANVKTANRLKFTPDGKLVFISTLRGSDVTIIDAATRRVKKRLRVGTGAAGIEMQPDGTRAFVACTPDNYVAIVDLKSLEVTGHLDAGKGPDGMTWMAQH